MTAIDPALFVRVTLVGVAVAVGTFIGIETAFITADYRRKFVFKEWATRRDKARVWFDYVRGADHNWRRFTKYAAAWGVAGGLLFALGTLVAAGIGAVFL